MGANARCPIGQHDHPLNVVKVLTQAGTGQKAELLECPTGRYRWLSVEGREPIKEMKMVRPRFGWKTER